MLSKHKQEKELLIERLGVFIERQEQIAPLASRILATLILTGKQGCTFDELVYGLQASKSSISTHLKGLQQAEKITYFTRCGDRKKYFEINPRSLLIKLEDMLTTWEQERVLHQEIVAYKEHATQLVPGETDLDFHKDFILYLDQAQESISKIRDKAAQKLKNEYSN